MLLTVQRHEILAETGIGIPYSGRLFYELSHFRDRHTGLLGRISSGLGFGAIALLALIESAIRFPLALLSLAFSRDSSCWFKGLSLSILTTIFSFYALLINLFIHNISSRLINFDLGLRFPLKNHFLFEACEAGHYDLGKQLLKEAGADPHHVFEVGVSSALVPRLLGHTKLDPLFELNDYEKEYLELKLLSHLLGLEGDVELHGNKLKLQGAPAHWFFDPLATLVGQFTEWDDFHNLELGEGNAAILEEALRRAYTEHSYENIAKTIQEKKLCFLGSGWKRHGICLAFYGEYMAIGNTGDGAASNSTLDVCKIDPSLCTAEIVEEILMYSLLDAETAKKYFYEILPAKLSRTGKKEKDPLCEAFAGIAPKPAKAGVCGLASKKSALRFAWGMLLSERPNEATLKQARFETKLFTDWAATMMLDLLKSNQLAGLKPRDEVIAQAQAKGKPKVNRLWWNRWKAIF